MPVPRIKPTNRQWVPQRPSLENADLVSRFGQRRKVFFSIRDVHF